MSHLKLFLIIFCLLNFLYNVNCEDDPDCKLTDGRKGYCVQAGHCIEALQAYKLLKPVEICPPLGEISRVCCPDSKCLQIIRKTGKAEFHSGYGSDIDGCAANMYSQFHCQLYGGIFKSLSEDMQCDATPFRSPFGYIAAGGTDAKRAQYPHMALLGYGDTPATADWMCGGTLITDSYILTAAHCISSPSLGEVKFITLGILKRTDPPSYWQRYDVKRIIPYPEYDAPSKYHDIALLETTIRVRYNREALPACLNRDDSAASTAVATGWGALGHRKPLAEVLQTVSVDKFTDEECMAAYPAHRHLKDGYNSTTQMCYGEKEKINDTCEGDSGGPLQVEADGASKSRCLFKVLGVTSYGRSCGFVGGSGMYTRVSHYVPWIESVVGKLS